MKFKELYPKVLVYQDLLPEPDRLYQIMKASEHDADGRFYLRKWDKWSVFGTYVQEKHEDSEHYEPREFGKRYDDEKYLATCVIESYSKAIDHYIGKYNVAVPEGGRLMSSSFSKYDSDLDVLKNGMTMPYHTDFNIAERAMPGNKFFLTCTTYINDDYDGGDICFYINGDFINYKPKAGDILVFPSGMPYYHGVKTIRNGNKFFIRNFISYPFNGTKEWLAKQREFGAPAWADKERERLAYETPRNMLYMYNNQIVSYDDLLKM
jgi:hypothetical protein